MSNNRILKLLRTHKEMSEVYQELYKKDFKYPYFFEVKKQNQILYFLGTKHTSDPEDPQIKRIVSKWQEFLRLIDKNKTAVLIEGGMRSLEKTQEKAILNHGEAGLMVFLAHQEKIKVLVPEPDVKTEIEEIAKEFGKERAIYYYFARTVYQWQRHTKKTSDFKPYVNIFLNGYEKLLKWQGFDFSLENMIKLHDKYHGHKFDLDNEECFYKNSNPAEDAVSSASSIIRDIHIVSEIHNLWENGMSIFVVYGSGHAITQEPALKKLLT